MQHKNLFYKIAYLKRFWDFRKNKFYFYDFDGTRCYFDNNHWYWNNRKRYWFKFRDDGKKIVSDPEKIFHLI